MDMYDECGAWRAASDGHTLLEHAKAHDLVQYRKSKERAIRVGLYVLLGYAVEGQGPHFISFLSQICPAGACQRWVCLEGLTVSLLGLGSLVCIVEGRFRELATDSPSEGSECMCAWAPFSEYGGLQDDNVLQQLDFLAE